MSKKTLEDVLLNCRLEFVEINGKIYPGLMCNAERTEIYINDIRTYQTKFAHYPSEYRALLNENEDEDKPRKVPYISAVDISATSKNKKNLFEIAFYGIGDKLEIKKSAIVKERNGQITRTKMIELKEEDLRRMQYTFRDLMRNIYGHLLNRVDSGTVLSSLRKMNNTIENILSNYVVPNFDRPLNRISKYPTFYEVVKLIVPNPEVLRQIDPYVII